MPTSLSVRFIAVLLLAFSCASSVGAAESHAPRFEIVAWLLRPENASASFRSVALKMPWCYVLDRDGRLHIFNVPTNRIGEHINPTHILPDAGDGNDLKIFGDTLICTRNGSLQTFSLKSPGSPKATATVGPSKPYGSQSIARSGNVLFLIGTNSIASYDVSVPSRPVFLNVTQTNRRGWTGCAAGRFLYVGEIKINDADRQGIAVYDASDPKNPKEVGFVPTSRAPFDLFQVPQEGLLACMDSDSPTHSRSPRNITVSGNCALLDITKASRPVVIKEFPGAGGGSATMLKDGQKSYLVCDGVIFSVEERALQETFSFLPPSVTPNGRIYHGWRLDGTPYHGDSDGLYAALAYDGVAVVLKLRR
jgi:hypothetical protein